MAKECTTGLAIARAIAKHKCFKYGDHAMIKILNRVIALLFITAPFLVAPNSQAGTLGGSTSYTPAYSWTWSSELVTFTRENITLKDDNGDTIAIIAAPTFDITESPECTPTDIISGQKITCDGSALFKGILKVRHIPEAGEAWAEFQMKWPTVKIEITPQEVVTGGIIFLKEIRTYKVELSSTESNEYKLTDGYKRVVPDLPRSGVYTTCDGTDSSLEDHNCYQEIGYGTELFDPADVFDMITTASGLPIPPTVGFYWDEACVAFDPDDLDFTVDGEVFYLKEDADGRFRSCEGRAVALQVCTKNSYIIDPDTNEKVETKVTGGCRFDGLLPLVSCLHHLPDPSGYHLRGKGVFYLVHSGSLQSHWTAIPNH